MRLTTFERLLESKRGTMFMVDINPAGKPVYHGAPIFVVVGSYDGMLEVYRWMDCVSQDIFKQTELKEKIIQRQDYETDIEYVVKKKQPTRLLAQKSVIYWELTEQDISVMMSDLKEYMDRFLFDRLYSLPLTPIGTLKSAMEQPNGRGKPAGNPQNIQYQGRLAKYHYSEELRMKHDPASSDFDGGPYYGDVNVQASTTTRNIGECEFDRISLDGEKPHEFTDRHKKLTRTLLDSPNPLLVEGVVDGPKRSSHASPSDDSSPRDSDSGSSSSSSSDSSSD